MVKNELDQVFITLNISISLFPLIDGANTNPKKNKYYSRDNGFSIHLPPLYNIYYLNNNSLNFPLEYNYNIKKYLEKIYI